MSDSMRKLKMKLVLITGLKSTKIEIKRLYLILVSEEITYFLHDL